MEGYKATEGGGKKGKEREGREREGGRWREFLPRYLRGSNIDHGWTAKREWKEGYKFTEVVKEREEAGGDEDNSSMFDTLEGAVEITGDWEGEWECLEERELAERGLMILGGTAIGSWISAD